MAGKRKYFSTEQKLAIIKSHLIEKIAVSTICESHGIQPSVYYTWQKTLLERGHLDGSGRNQEVAYEAALKKHRKREHLLETKLQQKDTVLAELMADYVALKKSVTGEI